VCICVVVTQGSVTDDDGSLTAVVEPVCRAAAVAQPGGLGRRRRIVLRRHAEELPRTVHRTMRGVPARGLSTLDRRVSSGILLHCPVISVQRWFLSKDWRAEKCLESGWVFR